MQLNKKKGIGFWTFVMYGINSIFGLTFLISLGSVYRNVGNWMFMLALVGSIIAFSVGYVYAHLAKNLHSKGGVYNFVKRAFGYRSAFFFNWCQYIQAPAVAAAGILSMVLSFSNLSWYRSYLWVIILGAALLYTILSLFLIFGFHSTRLLLIILTMCAIGTYIFYYLSAFVSKDFFHNLTNAHSDNISYSFTNFIIAFFTFFFALGGIENLASSCEELEDKKGVVVKGLVFVMLLTIGGYFLAMLVILGVLGDHDLSTSSSNLDNNPLNLMWKDLYGPSAAVVIILIFAIFKILSESGSNLSNGWLTAYIIEPYAEDGFLTPAIAHRNRFNQLNRAIIVHVIVTSTYLVGIFIALFALPKGNQTIAAPFAIYSILAFIQYIGVLLSFLVLMKRRIIKMHHFLYCYYTAITGVVIFLTAAWFYSSIYNALPVKGSHLADNSLWITFIAATLSLLFGALVYFIGSVCKWHDHGWKLQKKLAIEHTDLDYGEAANKR